MKKSRKAKTSFARVIKKKEPQLLIEELVPVVGIGASAGGLDPLQTLFQALPYDLGMAYVVVQHLDPDKKSALVSILSKSTRMQVTEVVEAVRIVPDHVYVIPPGADLTLVDGRLHLAPRTSNRGRPVSIDTFFGTLGRVRKSDAIGVILSGSGEDGSIGMQIIKNEGGLTFAQDEGSAAFPSMPLAAARTGCVDFVLSPAAIAKELARISRHPFLKPVVDPSAPNASSDSESGFENVIAVLTKAFHVDFNRYKLTTLKRRILRRMVLHSVDTPFGYEALLKKDPRELQAIYDDLLINVTEFFRDPEVFRTLKTKIFPSILKNRKQDGPLRIWVPGCSTGEEAYSILIVLLEYLEKHSLNVGIQIFATDISERCIDKARAAVYSESLVKNVSPERLAKFFRKIDGSYKVAKSVRDFCVFSIQNVTADPPFSNIDLISCRNLLIYLGPELQKRVLPTFHYALTPHGFLLLGAAETIGSFSNLFGIEDNKCRFFSKKAISGWRESSFGPSRVFQNYLTQDRPPEERRKDPLYEIRREAEKIALDFGPCGTVINDDFEILHSIGDTSFYLSLPAGSVSINLLKMVRKGLEIELRAAVQKAKKAGLPFVTENLDVKTRGEVKHIRLEVFPLRSSTEKNRNFLVLFNELRDSGTAPGQARVGSGNQSKPNAQTKKSAASELNRARVSLETARETLRVTVETNEAIVEELKSANEEILSGNEELQSSNEELETAKEELQATNEELTTVNEELRNGNEELSNLNNDLTNVLVNSPVPLLIVGRDLRLRRFTPVAQKTLGLRPADIDQPIKDLNLGLTASQLDGIVTNVIEDLSEFQGEVQDSSGKWHSLQVRPYKTVDNNIDGAVITLVDIDVIRRSREEAVSIVHTVREPLVILDKDFSVLSASRSFYSNFRMSVEETEHRSLFELGAGQWNIPELKFLLNGVLSENNDFYDYEVTAEFREIGTRMLLLNARRIPSSSFGGNTILLAIEDITDRKLKERDLEKNAADLKRVNTDLEQFAYIASHDLQEPLRTMSMYMQLLGKKLRNQLDVDTTRYLDVASTSTKRMQLLVSDLLDFSRATSLEIKFEPTDCAAVLSRVLTTLSGQIDESQASVKASKLPTVLADEVLLGQVFQNLIGNAIKFRRADKAPEVKISAKEFEHEWRFSVQDNGIGIDQQYADKVFLIFQRLHNAEDYAGTGIGLSMCKNIVERYGGRIWLESQLGKGTTFHFTIPKSRR